MKLNYMPDAWMNAMRYYIAACPNIWYNFGVRRIEIFNSIANYILHLIIIIIIIIIFIFIPIILDF